MGGEMEQVEAERSNIVIEKGRKEEAGEGDSEFL